jgi:hypothetical protein
MRQQANIVYIKNVVPSRHDLGRVSLRRTTSSHFINALSKILSEVVGPPRVKMSSTAVSLPWYQVIGYGQCHWLVLTPRTDHGVMCLRSICHLRYQHRCYALGSQGPLNDIFREPYGKHDTRWSLYQKRAAVGEGGRQLQHVYHTPNRPASMPACITTLPK